MKCTCGWVRVLVLVLLVSVLALGYGGSCGNADTTAGSSGGGGGTTAIAAPTGADVQWEFFDNKLQATLTWVNNSTNETGFIIERSNPTNANYTEVARVGANVTSLSGPAFLWAATQLDGVLNCYYRVRAYNETTFSPYSNEAVTETPIVNGTRTLPIP